MSSVRDLVRGKAEKLDTGQVKEILHKFPESIGEEDVCPVCGANTYHHGRYGMCFSCNCQKVIQEVRQEKEEKRENPDRVENVEDFFEGLEGG